jgi:hypothetical protein
MYLPGLSWIEETVTSSDGVTKYVVSAHWNVQDERWESTTCHCKGFIRWGKCKHMAEQTERLKDTPGPVSIEDAELRETEGQHLRCSICQGYEFIIFRRRTTQLTTYRELICSKCGRMYVE